MVVDERLPILESTNVTAVRSALTSHGAVMVRAKGAGMSEFIELSDALMVPIVHHATNTIERDPVSKDPSTSTVNKGIDSIPLHREASYAPGCPDLLIFFCERPAASGGETVICDGARLLDELQTSTREFVEDLELYWNWEARPVRWQQTLGARTIEEAKKALGYLDNKLKPYEKLEYHFEGEDLHGRFRTRAVVPSLTSGVPSFCNSLMIHAYRPKSDFYARDDFRVHLADGSPFPSDILAEIRDVAERVSLNVSWNPGEIVVIDNSRFMHGRRHFDDVERRILLRMGQLRSAS
ncbi:MAG: TauD/TfdA family dioxygenase [Pseudomonas gingeri]